MQESLAYVSQSLCHNAHKMMPISPGLRSVLY